MLSPQVGSTPVYPVAMGIYDPRVNCPGPGRDTSRLQPYPVPESLNYSVLHINSCGGMNAKLVVTLIRSGKLHALVTTDHREPQRIIRSVISDAGNLPRTFPPLNYKR